MTTSPSSAPIAFNQLARHAGVGVGVVYRHFADPDALLDELIDGRVDAVVAVFDRASEATTPSLVCGRPMLATPATEKTLPPAASGEGDPRG